MFDFLFGWRKASKCKKLIKRLQCRLKLLKTKRHSIVKQLREDVAHLLKLGYEHLAYKRAEHLFNDQTTLSVYELLENFCQFIIFHLSYIRRNKDCPNDINEAASSLIFASARCGDLPELRAIRKLFRERYGQRFEITALELLPGNLVNLQVKEKLSIKSVPDDVKQKLLDEIVKDYCLQPVILAIDYTTEKHIVEPCKVGNPNSDDLEGKVIHADAESTVPSDPHQEDIISNNVSSSTVEQCLLNVTESPIKSFKAVNTKESRDCKVFQKMTGSSSESLPQFPEEMIVYLDDIEEVTHKEGSCQDQRTFKFKSSVLPNNLKAEQCYDVKYDSWSDSLGSNSRKRIKAAKKRRKRRSMSQEIPRVKDIHCVIYYDKPYKKSAFNKLHRRKPERYRQKQPQSCCCFSLEGENCSLKHPCYFHTGNGRDDRKFPRPKLKDTTIRRLESDTEVESEFGGIASNDSSPKSTSTLTRKAAKSPYLRAMTMPQERSKGNLTNNVSRSSSFPVRPPNYVHPKLPDYDEIAAKFKALKKEHQQNKHH